MINNEKRADGQDGQKRADPQGEVVPKTVPDPPGSDPLTPAASSHGRVPVQPQPTSIQEGQRPPIREGQQHEGSQTALS